jgi:hypothetical protein
MKKTQTLELYVVSITRLSTGDTLTDCFQDKGKATHAFIKLCCLNKAEFKNAISRHDDYIRIAVGSSNDSQITLSVYEIN